MTETSRLGLPLLQAAQAQKHVTVNEALTRLDGLVQLALQDVDVVNPPLSPADGDAYGVGTAATGDWVGQDDKVAVFANGIWSFVSPVIGWEAYVVPANARMGWDGTGWRRVAPALSSGGAETVTRIIEADFVLGAGTDLTTPDLIPAGSQVIGVTARVIAPFSGAGLTTWSFGVPGAVDRYGSGLGIALNAYARGITGQPVTYWNDTPLQLTADAGSFAGGTVRIAIHLTELIVPAPV